MICECGGLIAEKGKSYCYAGKFCYCDKPTPIKTGTQSVGGMSSAFNNFQVRAEAALELLNTLKDMLGEDRILEIIKEPCKHEPEENHFIEYIASKDNRIALSEVMRMIRDLRQFKCKHCGKSIKAEKWILS